MAESGSGEKEGGQAFTEGTGNSQAMREGNRTGLDCQALVLMSERIGE